MGEQFQQISDALSGQFRQLRRAQNGFAFFSAYAKNLPESGHVLFMNAHGDGIEILVSKDHYAALERALATRLNCCFEVTTTDNARRIATATVTIIPPVVDTQSWQITLISPITLDLVAETRMFEQLRQRYGLGEPFRRELERCGVIPTTPVDVSSRPVGVGAVSAIVLI